MRCWAEACRAEVTADDAACPTCGALLRIRDTYRIMCLCGQGGMGVVYQALDEALGRTVAVKLLHGQGEVDPRHRDRFRTECKAMAALDHPGIARIYAADSHFGQLFFVQQFVPGRSLKAFLRDHAARAGAGTAPELGFVLRVTGEILDALDHAHAQGIVHRDVNPNNVLLSERDGELHPVLIDFGMARTARQEATRVAWGGTAGFAAPEQMLESDSNDCRSDIYAVAAVAYAMLARGKPPYDEVLVPGIGNRPRDMLRAYDQIARGGVKLRCPAPDGVSVPPALWQLLERALAPAPADRFPSARSMLEALRELEPAADGSEAPTAELRVTQSETRAPPQDIPPAEHARGVPRRWAVGAACLVLALLAVAAWRVHFGKAGDPGVVTGKPSAAAAASGAASAVSAAGLAPTRQLPTFYPGGIAVGADGAVYLADRGNHRIQVVRNGRSETFAGSTMEGFADGPTAEARFDLPRSVAVTDDGVVYVADRGNHRIRKVSQGQVSTVAGGFEAGHVDGPLGVSKLRDPAAVAIGPDGVLYVADAGNHCIRMWKDGLLSTLSGTPNAGMVDGPVASARFNQPSSLSVAADGTIYVYDVGNLRLRAIHNGQVRTLAALGQRPNELIEPVTRRFAIHPMVAVGRSGRVYLSDPTQHRVLTLAEGALVPFAGQGKPGDLDDYAPKATFDSPIGVAEAPDGALYVTDAGAGSLRVVRDGRVSTVTRAPRPGFVDGAAAQARFAWPWGIQLMADGSLVVADWHNRRIRKIASAVVATLAGSGETGSFDGPAEVAQFASPWDVALGPAGAIYVADGQNHRIRVIEAGAVRTLAGTGKPGALDGPTAVASFFEPEGLDVDAAGIVYVADTGNQRIRAIANGTVRTVAGTGAAGLDDGDALKATFRGPGAVIVGSDGALVVADTGNHCIRKIHHGRVVTLAGTGEPGFRDGQAATAQFQAPVGLSIGADGTVVVADTGNHRIRVIRDGEVHTVAGTGQPGYLDGDALSGELSRPADAQIAPNGDIYIADTGNQLLRVLSAGRLRTYAGSFVSQ